MAALMVDQMWIIQPKVPNETSHTTPAVIKKKRDARILPCSSWPSPGTNKLAKAEITFPADPCPADITF
jgi:hypothetical protein